jgi:hypothetical protein
MFSFETAPFSLEAKTLSLQTGTFRLETAPFSLEAKTIVFEAGTIVL